MASPAPERPPAGGDARQSARPAPVDRPAPVADLPVPAAAAPQPMVSVAADPRGPSPSRAAPGVPSPNGAASDERERSHLRPAVVVAAPSATAIHPALESSRSDGAVGVEDLRPTCTVAQLRRFIKSRPWVPMHELRRRFGINGAEDDVTPIRVGDLRLYIGLPPLEGHLMAELLGSGDVGYELSLDPGAPVVVGVYPMRPVPRS